MARREYGERPVLEGPRVNDRIRISPIRLVLEDGSQLGVVTLERARMEAKEKGLDLVEISPNARPPVCKLMDYGKFKYEQSKKQNEIRKNQKNVQLKQVKFRPKTDEHDLQFKIRNIKRFLEEGHKVQLEVSFKGRENAHPEAGMSVINRVIEEVNELAKVEQAPVFENKAIVTTICPK